MPPLVHAPITELVWWTSFAAICVVFGALFAVRKVSLLLTERRMHKINALHFYHQRLQLITSELLSQANELDQNSKYLPSDATQTSSAKIGVACDELVKLGQTLPLIEQLLEGKNVRQSEEGILQSCRMATKISRELEEIRLAEPKLLGDKKQPRKSSGICDEIWLAEKRKNDPSESR